MSSYHAWTHAPKAQGGTDPMPGGQYPICFRAAIGDIDDPEADREHYMDGFDQNVFWDVWDEDYDTSVYDTGPYEQTRDAEEGLVIAGVGLLLPGLYSIFAQIDVDNFFNGVTLMRSNWDEGMGTFAAHSYGYSTDPYWGDFIEPRLDHWRAYEHPQDNDFGGEAGSIEIVFGISDMTAMPGVTFGKDPPGVGGVPVPGEEYWIPGGHAGAYGVVPHLVVAYWGDLGPGGWYAGAWS